MHEIVESGAFTVSFNYNDHDASGLQFGRETVAKQSAKHISSDTSRNLAGTPSLANKLFGAGFARIREYGDQVKAKLMDAVIEQFDALTGDEPMSLSKSVEVFNFNYDREAGERKCEIPVYNQEQTDAVSSVGIDVTCDDCFSFADLTFTIEVRFNQGLDDVEYTITSLCCIFQILQTPSRN